MTVKDETITITVTTREGTNQFVHRREFTFDMLDAVGDQRKALSDHFMELARGAMNDVGRVL